MGIYLVTGGAGFIGSNFIHYLLRKYDDRVFVINLDKLTYAGNINNLKDIEARQNYAFVKGDICDENLVDDIFNKYDIDYVINFAAESHVDRSIKDSGPFVKTNILGTQTLLNISRRNWEEAEGFKEGKRYLQISTDEVYGSLGEDGYFTEKTPLDPHSPYSASKAAADLLVKACFDTYKMPILITRCSNNYGPYQFPEKLIPLIINNCLNCRSVPVYGDGKNVRDWIYVEDHCAAIDSVLDNGKPGEIYNIGGNGERQNIDIVKGIIQTLREILPDDDLKKVRVNEDLISYIEDRKGHDRRYAIDASKLRSEMNWQPEVAFEQGVHRTIKWYLENEEWLKQVTSGSYKEYYRETYVK